MAKRRTFRDYIAPNGENVVRAWLNGLPVKARAKIDARLHYLEAADQLDMPYARKLTGECDGLIELRFKTTVQYRPLCCTGPGRGDVTILIGAIEKGGRFEPLSACATARMRAAHIGEEGRTHEHEFD